jgi:hypothetical protein
MNTSMKLLVALSMGGGLTWGSTGNAQEYDWKGGYPTPQTVQDVYDAVDQNRAVGTYRYFYPTVSGAAIFSGNAKVGVQPNRCSASWTPNRGTSVTRSIRIRLTAPPFSTCASAPW